MDSHRKLLLPLILIFTSLGALVLSLLCFWIHKYLKTKSHTSSDAEKGLGLAPLFRKFNSLRTVSKTGSASYIEYKVLEKGTDNFHGANILGEGGFGRVYKGRLENNLNVAVKKLDRASQDVETEFENEVQLLSNIQHPNIIFLLGYSVEADTRFIVYELMQHGSLETKLHGPSRGSSLNWQMRMKIALDVASWCSPRTNIERMLTIPYLLTRGLEYLHEQCNPPVIHRDLKSANILLDSNFNAKISDFGLAVTAGGQNKNIKLSGTLGYVAPEYLLDGKLTDKSDVYAFGAVLLELLLGRRPVESLALPQCRSIVTWAMPQLTDRSKLPHIIDPVIKDTMDPKHLYQVAAVALLCVQPEPSYRPLITDVLHSLVPLVPLELGGTLRVMQPILPIDSKLPFSE